jgi:hypothetical protein
MPGTELILKNRTDHTNHVAVEELFAAIWAQSYVWWMTFIETASEEYVMEHRPELEQCARNAWEGYRNSLKWAEKNRIWQEKGWLS